MLNRNHFLYEVISKYKREGYSYQIIADKLNAQKFYPVRGVNFTKQIVGNIYRKYQ